MVTNSVSTIPDLAAVQTIANHDAAKGGNALTFDQYKALLLSAATKYDDAQKKWSPRGRSNRNVYQSNRDSNYFDNTPASDMFSDRAVHFMEDNVPDHDIADSDLDIHNSDVAYVPPDDATTQEYNIDTLLANVTERRPPFRLSNRPPYGNRTNPGNRFPPRFTAKPVSKFVPERKFAHTARRPFARRPTSLQTTS